LLTGETYPISAEDRRKEHLHKKKRSPLLLIGFVVLCLILIAAIAVVVYRAIGGTPIPPLLGGRTEVSVPAAEAGEAAEAEAAEPVEEEEAEPTQAAAAEQPAEQATAERTSGGVWYEIKWGDTLWDISATYYRNPWLYPKIARENSITNPDLIFAGTKLFIPEN
jgi:nucleoid-associated protein YgaU